MTRLALAAAAAALAGPISPSPAAAQAEGPGTGAAEPAEDTPPGVDQLIPRGTLSAVFDPVFVPATDAGLPDDAWVLGVAVDGEARAYSLNLLNQHEVVNDRLGEHPFAAVW